MEPVQVICEVLVRRWKGKSAIRISVDDILAYCARFRKGNGVAGVGQVLEYWRCAKGVFGFKLWWREEWGAFVKLEIIGYVEFFEEPRDTFALTYL
jgi:hypothetical protein